MFKKTFLAICALAAFVCCSKNAPSYDDGGKDGKVTLSARIVSAETVKTWVDTSASATILPVYWSDGDAINVNGQASAPITVGSGEKLLQASFELSSVQVPYNVVYPSSIIKDTKYSEEGSIGIIIPSVQKYTPGSFASGSAILYGYSQAAQESVRMQNLCAVIRVSLTSGTPDNDIYKASITALGDDDSIAGEYSICPSSGELLAVEGVKTIELEIDEPIALGAAQSDFWFALPAGLYEDGFEISFTRNSDHRKMLCNWTSVKSLEAGKIYHFSSVEFVPGAKDIETPDDWEEFAVACNEGGDVSKWIYADGYVHIGEDITKENLTQINDFKYCLDGKGHTITRTEATGSLIDKVSGKVRNLTLDGSFSSVPCNGAALATTLADVGKVESCTNNMDLSLALCDDDVALAGIVGIMEGGCIEDCVNTGNITARVNLSAANHACQIAGIVAKVSPVAEDSVYIRDCLNKGEICFAPTAPGRHTFCPTYFGLAGIAGYLNPTTKAFFVLDNCDNEGTIVFNADGITDETGMYASALSVGGVVGLAATLNTSSPAGTSFTKPSGTNGVSLSLTDCDNSGSILNNGVNYSTSAQAGNKSFSGGIIGSVTGNAAEGMAVLDNCSNTGSVIPYDLTGETSSSRPAYCSVMGGMIGFGAYVTMKDCYVKCVLGDGKRPVVTIGGAIGYCVRAFKIQGCRIYYTGYFQRLTGYKSNRAVAVTSPVKYTGGSAMGIEPDLTDSEITNSHLGAYLNTCTSTLTSDNKEDLVEARKYNAVIFITESDVMNNLVCGEGLSDEQKAKVYKEGNQFWDGI